MHAELAVFLWCVVPLIYFGSFSLCPFTYKNKVLQKFVLIFFVIAVGRGSFCRCLCCFRGGWPRQWGKGAHATTCLYMNVYMCLCVFAAFALVGLAFRVYLRQDTHAEHVMNMLLHKYMCRMQNKVELGVHLLPSHGLDCTYADTYKTHVHRCARLACALGTPCWHLGEDATPPRYSLISGDALLQLTRSSGMRGCSLAPSR